MPWLNVPLLPQAKPGWCLPACVAMVAAYWQQPLSQSEAAQRLGTRSIGTQAYADYTCAVLKPAA